MLLCDTFLKVFLHLILDVLLEATDDQALVTEILGRVVLRVTDRGGVEQRHQRRKAAG